MENLILQPQELYNKVIELELEQRIFIPVEENLVKDLRFVYFKRDGLNNIVLSYINATNEMANMMNFEKFVERVAESKIQEQDLIATIGKTYLGDELYTYLTIPGNKHMFSIDFNNSLLIIHHKDTPSIKMDACGCSDGSCGI